MKNCYVFAEYRDIINEMNALTTITLNIMTTGIISRQEKGIE